MRKLLLILALSTLVGCAWIKEQKANVAACEQDPQCWSEAVAKAHNISEKAGDIASLTPVPPAPVKTAAGLIALPIFLAILGSALRKKNDQKSS